MSQSRSGTLQSWKIYLQPSLFPILLGDVLVHALALFMSDGRLFFIEIYAYGKVGLEKFIVLSYSSVARLETFRALLKSSGQIVGVQGPKTLQIGEFQGPKCNISNQNHYFKKENNLNRVLGILIIYSYSHGSCTVSGKL